MEKVSISRFTEKIIEQHGSDNAEAVLIIAVDGEHVTTSCIGPDPMFINDKSVALVGAMRAILDTKFKLASAMHDHLKQHGRIWTEIQEKVVDEPAESFEPAKPKEQQKPNCPPKATDPEEEFIHGLFDLLERTFGGVKNAHDD